VIERPQARLTELAQEALELLEEHIRDQGEDGLRDDFSWNLLKALQPFEPRPKHWLRVNCSCGHLVTRAMYHDGAIFLGQETREKLAGGGTLIRPAPGPTPNVELAHFPPPAGFENEPAGAHVWARRKLRCPSCRRTFTYGAVGLLRSWLRAVTIGSDVLVLGQQPSAARRP
jgi:hypothetical protein